MISFRKSQVSLCPLLLATFLATAACDLAETNSVPSDFRLYAHYYPGYSNWEPWALTITPDGKAVQETYSFPDGKEQTNSVSFKLTKEDLQELVTKVHEARFFKLAKDYSYEVTDNDTLVLRVTMNKKSHEVSVYASLHLRDNDEVRRFLKIWNLVLKKVPSPNVKQKED